MTDTHTPHPGAPEPQQPAPAAYPAPPAHGTYAPPPPTGYGPPAGSPYGAPPAPPTAREKNVLGLVALITAALGFVFACIPGAMFIGWILLPIALILGIVAVCLRGKSKWQGVTAIVVSVVGTIVGIIVFFVVVAAAFSSAVDDLGDVNVSDPSVVTEDETTGETDGELADSIGTRENPAPLGSEIEGDDWSVVINSVELDAEAAILEENTFNEAADKGTQYILINYTATYTGDDAEGQFAAMVDVAYVTAEGVTVNSYDKIVVAPDEIDTMSTLYEGASVSGNTAIQVPAPVDGVLAVRAGILTDTVFVALD